MPHYNNIREEELKNKVAEDWFGGFDHTKIIGNIDFAITLKTEKNQTEIFDAQYLFWAEAKKGTVDPVNSIAQLILTIGKAKTCNKILPPNFLGCFDYEKIAFIPYDKVLDIFHMNDFNWNVTPSNKTTREFSIVTNKIKETFEKEFLIFDFEKEPKKLKEFIAKDFVDGKNPSKITITKNNFTHTYYKWTEKVKPTISIQWEDAKKNGIIDGDFYLADLLSEDNKTLKEKLFVLLEKDKYHVDRKITSGMLDEKKAGFNDGQKSPSSILE